MRDEWKQMTLREAGVSLIDCDHRTPPAAAGGYPYVAIPQLKQGRIVLSDVRHITKSHFLEWTKKNRPRPYDVVVSRRCNPGETAFVPQGLEFALGQNLVLLRSDDSKVFPPFLRWLLRSQGWWEQVGKFINVGAVFDSLRCADIPNFQLLFPPLPEQQAIADILGSLDDKIELNRRMNETLESMARALFKSWFVDFDPVVAKSEGRHPEGMDAETAKLFPDSFEDSEIGRIPKGWKVLPFAETVDLMSGGTPKTNVADFWGGGIPWFSVVDSPSDSDVFVMETEKTITQAGIDNSATQVLPIGTTIISARGTVGKTCIVGVPMAMNQSCFGLCDRSSDKGYFTYYGTKSLVSTLQNHAHGSVFATINRNTFKGVHTIVPPQASVHAFEEVVDPLLGRIRSNLLERRTLATTRDTLLPRLLSGELRFDVRGLLYE